MEIKNIYLRTQSHKVVSLDKKRDMLSHAYMIECADKFLLDEYVKFLSKEIFCTSQDTPCDKCNNCLKVEHSNMVDLKVFPKDKNIVVDDINQIIDDAYQKPMDSIYKVYVLKNFDEATIQAQNKILKTLEEPPRNVIFILSCSNSSLVLPTISSRVKTINEPLLNLSDAVEVLESLNVNNADSVAKISGGNISIALKLSSSTDADKFVDLAFSTLMELKTSSDIIKFSSKICTLKKDFISFVDTLIMIIRDISVSEIDNLINFQDRKNDIKKLSNIYSKKACEEIVNRLCEIYNKMEFNCNLNGVVDQMLLDILEVKFLCQK